MSDQDNAAIGREIIGQTVEVRGSYNLWRGKVVAFSEAPCVLLELDNGHRMLMPVGNWDMILHA